MGAVHTAFLQTITDNANPTSGDVPVVVPGGGKGPGQCQDVAWTTAYPALSAFQHTYYGDARVAARHWPALQKYTANLVTNAAAQAPGRLPVCSSFKDWLWAGACTGAPAGSSCPVGQEMAGFSYVVGLRAMAAMAATVPPVNVCASAPELSVLQLGCREVAGATISKIEWSSFGTPVLGADCGAWASNATCDKDDANVTATLTALCVGKASCAVPVVQGHIFGPDPCALVKKTLAARATCTGGERTRVVAAARVTEGGTLVWDGKVLVGAPSGISGATDQPEGVAFEVSNGAFEFAATVAAASA